jgi:GT2 family glycosyltransferase
LEKITGIIIDNEHKVLTNSTVNPQKEVTLESRNPYSSILGMPEEISSHFEMKVIVSRDSDLVTLNETIYASESEFILIASPFINFDGLKLEKLIERMKQFPDVGAVQPKVMNASDMRFFASKGGAGGLIDQLGYHYIRGSEYGDFAADNAQFDKGFSRISWSDGTLTCIRKEAFISACGFDTLLRFDDAMMDFSLRIQKLGYEIHLVSESVAALNEEPKHKKSAGSDIKDDILLRVRMLLRYESRFLLPLMLIHFFFDLFRSVIFLLRFRLKSSIAIAQSYGYIFQNIPNWLSERGNLEELSCNSSGRVHAHPFSIYWQHFGKLGDSVSNALAIFLVIASVFSLTMRDRR